MGAVGHRFGWLLAVGLTAAAVLFPRPASALSTGSAHGSVAGVAGTTVLASAAAATAGRSKAALGARSVRGSVKKAKATTRSSRRAVRRLPPLPPSHGTQLGLRQSQDPLDLGSSAALVVDLESNEVLFSKNDRTVLPIASLTKLMTALVVVEARLPMDERLTVDAEDIGETVSRARSKLIAGSTLTREEMLHLSLMASENRAAHVLARHYPGGTDAFVQAMNQAAHKLGMKNTTFVEPTGLSSSNRSTARDLATLVRAAHEHDQIRRLSTSTGLDVALGHRQIAYRNTNRLVDNPTWTIGLQKTGYISAAGRCLVMQTTMAGRKLVMVLLDSAGKYTRLGDAERIRKWLADAPVTASSKVPAVEFKLPAPAATLPAVPVGTAAGDDTAG
jgi:serine-type D-Ala-D-Ala endopeptidase (penicillin-binding protein 7)